MNTPKVLACFAVAVVLAIGAYTVHDDIKSKQNAAVLAGSFNPTGAGTYLLQSSISQSQSTITLSAAAPFAEPSSGILYTMSYLGSNIEYGTISPANGTTQTDNSEFVSFTGITQNGNGSATLTGVTRGLARTPGTGGCVASSTLAHAYPSQTKFILSNSPCFYSQYAVKQNAETIAGLWTYSSTSPPKLDFDPTAAQWAAFSSSSLVTYHQLQLTSFSGTTNASITAKGISQLASSTQAASSTDVGSSGAEQVLMAKYATDTPQSCSGLKTGGCVVMSMLNAKISQTWLDLSQIFNFTGGLFVTGSSTYTATTTMQANSTTTNPLILANIPYAFPISIGAASSSLHTGPTGRLLWARDETGVVSTSTIFTAPSVENATAGATVYCVAPKVVSGGGVSGITSLGAVDMQLSAIVNDYPSASNAWTVTLKCLTNDNSGGTCSAAGVTAYALCVNP